MGNKKNKGFNEEFTRFFEEPTRDKLRALLQSHVGEMPHLDFKESWPKSCDLARHILAFGNGDGGCIILGVKEDSEQGAVAVGVEEYKDKADITKGINKFLPQPLMDAIEILDFSYQEAEYPTLKGKKFQVLIVESDARNKPFLALKDGESLKANVAYIRRGAASEIADHSEFQRIISQRIETRHSSLPQVTLVSHLEQLKVLMKERPSEGYGSQIMNSLMRVSLGRGNYDDFVVEMTQLKKAVIQRIVTKGE